MKLLLIHRAAKQDGEFQRVRQLASALSRSLSAESVEVLIVAPVFLMHWFKMGRPPKAIAGGRRLILPIGFPSAGSSILRRFNRFIQWTIGALISVLEEPNIIMGETHTSWPAVSGAKWVANRATLVVDIHGALPEEVEYSYPPSRSRDDYIKNAIKTERELMGQCDIVFCQSAPMISHLLAKYGAGRPQMRRFQCGVDLSRFSFSEIARSRMREFLGISPATTLFVYSGNLAAWQLIQDLFSIMRHYNREVDEGARLLVLTREPEDEVRKLAVNAGLLPSTVIIRAVEHNMVPEYLSAADIAFLLREDCIVNAVASPTKLGEYLACGLPVVGYEVTTKWEVWRDGPECFCILKTDTGSDQIRKLGIFVETILAAAERYRRRCQELAEVWLDVRLDIAELENTTNNVIRPALSPSACSAESSRQNLSRY